MSIAVRPDDDSGPQVLRELGSLERWYLLIDEMRSGHFSMVAEVSGKTTPAMWRVALDQLQLRHPLLNVCVEKGDNSSIRFLRVPGARIPLFVMVRSSPTAWQEEVKRELSTIFFASTAPLIRAVLLQAQDSCEIVLTVHHAIADGRSLLFLMRDLLEALAGQKLTPLPVPPSQDMLFGLMAEIRAVNDASKDQSESNHHVDQPNVFRINAGHQQINTFRLSREETQELLEGARKNRTTVHAAIVAALVLSGRTEQPNWRNRGVRIDSPICLRKILNIGTDCVPALTIGKTFLNPADGTDLWELARNAKAQLATWQTIPGIASSLERYKRVTANGASAAKVFNSDPESSALELVLTNVGSVPFKNKIGGLAIEAIWGPIVSLSGLTHEQLVGVATVNGTLCLSHTSIQPIPSLLEQSVALLLKSCRAPVPIRREKQFIWSGRVEIFTVGDQVEVEFYPGRQDALSDSIREALTAIGKQTHVASLQPLG